MSPLELKNELDPNWRGVCKIGGLAALAQLVCVAFTLVVAFALQGEPATVSEYFTALQGNRFMGILRMDFTSVANVTLYYLTFFGLYAALRRANGAFAALATALAFVGITLWLGSHSGLSMIVLSDQYAAATSEAQRTQLLAAGEAIIATDMWHSTGAFVGGVLLQSAGVVFALLMLPGKPFGKAIAYIGLITFGIDLLHIFAGLFTPDLAVYMMVVAGLFYPLWFFLVGRRMLQLGSKRSEVQI